MDRAERVALSSGASRANRVRSPRRCAIRALPALTLVQTCSTSITLVYTSQCPTTSSPRRSTRTCSPRSRRPSAASCSTNSSRPTPRSSTAPHLLRNSPPRRRLSHRSILCRAAPKPFGVLDADGTLWSAASVGTCKDRVDFAPDAETCYDLVALAVEQGGSKQAVGKRPLLTRSYESVGGKEVEKLTFSDTYEWTSYADWGELAALGASMVNWGGAKAATRSSSTPRRRWSGCSRARRRTRSAHGGDDLRHPRRGGRAPRLRADEGAWCSTRS